MVNVSSIVKKELFDLINSRLVIIVILMFSALLISENYTFYFDSGRVVITSSTDLVMGLGFDVYYYGSLLAAIIGYCSMTNETSGKALNTLLVKPVYRDTIINGKLLGVTIFLSLIFWVVTAVFIIAMYLMTGSAMNGYMPGFLMKLPFIFLLYLLCSTIMFSLSMLSCVLFKSPSFSLLVICLAWYLFFNFFNSVVFYQSLCNFFSMIGVGGYFSPDFLAYRDGSSIARYILSDDADNLVFFLQDTIPKFFRLSVYCVVSVVLTYITFIRRDVS